MSDQVVTPLTRPTLFFIGVTTAHSAIQRLFPRWAPALDLDDAVLQGVDLPLGANPAAYRAVVQRIKDDPLARGALVTTHKLDLFRAAADLFDDLGPYARRCAEVSCLAKRDSRLHGLALDPVNAGRALAAFLPVDHFARTGAHILCLGAGGAGLAIALHYAGAADRPARFLIADTAPERLAHMRAVLAAEPTPLVVGECLVTSPADNEALLAALPPGSLVINATGMGKDRPGSPLTDAARFPAGGYVWELNYRGARPFLHQARAQRVQQDLVIEDGWTYFLHGWSSVIGEVFEITMDAATFTRLADLAADLRPSS